MNPNLPRSTKPFMPAGSSTGYRSTIPPRSQYVSQAPGHQSYHQSHPSYPSSSSSPVAGPGDSRDAGNARVNVACDPGYQSYYQSHPSYPSSSSSPVAGPGDSRDADATLTQIFAQMTLSKQPHNDQPINVVLFGEPGVGKSAVVNLIARQNIAPVPSGSRAPTLLESARYNVSLDDIDVCLFETMGFGEPDIKGEDYSLALENAYKFVYRLSAVGDVRLVLFCVRANRLSVTTQSNYQLLSEFIFREKVPIALVVTGLEAESTMEGWWTRNRSTIECYGLENDGHVCITTVTDRSPRQNHNYAVSQRKIRELLKSYSLEAPAALPQTNDWFLRLGIGMQRFVEKHRKPTRQVIWNTLARLRLDPITVQEFLDTIEGNAQSNSRGGASRPQAAPLPHGVRHRDSEVDPPSSAPPSFQEWETRQRNDELQRADMVEMTRGGYISGRGQRSNEPLRWAAVEATGMAQYQCQYQYPNAVEEEDRRGWWDYGARRRETSSGRVMTEPRRTNMPHTESEMRVSMQDIRSNFPHDLTGCVTLYDRYPRASGSYGEIYRGEFRTSGKSTDVAIKVYRMYAQPDESLPERMKRFSRELGVWLNLQHPNVLPLFGTVRDMHPDIPAMVCPWVEHGSLSTYLERNTDLSVGERLTLIDDVAHGLHYLHSRRVVHGDLSGSNVLVYAGGRACIADFGLSTSLSAISGRTPATSRTDRGTVRWMAPELLGVDDSQALPTTRSDVYSFGSIMLQILTGNVPYHRHSRDEQVILAILRGTRPERSDPIVVTDNRWEFIKWCWFNGVRPSSNRIVEFTERELAGSTVVGY